MKRLLIWLIAILYGSLAIASNTITLSSVSGTPQTEVEVAVSLENTNAIVALEMVIPLGEHLSYVANSAVLATARSNGHMLSAAQVGQELRIYVYSFSQNALNGNTGELLTFRLQLGNEPADYALTPTVVLSDAAGASIDGSVQAGSVAIQAPKLQIINSQIDYGHIPIREVYTQELFLENVGNLPLVIEDITTTDPLLMPLQTALTIEAGQTASVSIEYAPVVRGAISKEVLVKSNAINGDQVATIIADPFSVNELHVGSASGIADSIVTISLTMNNMEPIVAMQCAFVLPEQLEYVANSLVLNSTRSNGHVALSTVNKFVEKQNQWYDSKGDTLVLMLYSMTNQPLLHNDGEIATFQLRLNGNSGGYGLYPQDVVLSNITEENMVSATYEGWVNIQSPSLYGTDDLQFGNCPITETAVATYSFNNYGDAPLQIERVTFLAEGYRVVTPLPLVVNPWEEGSLQIAYDPKLEGDFSTTMNLYTNDPTNRLKAVAISGHVYEPNSLIIDGGRTSNGNYQISVALNNYTDIVALQYDIHWRSDMTTSQTAFTPTARLRNHTCAVVPMGADTYRVLIYSLSNTPISGKEGELHQLEFTPQGDVDYCGDILTIDNIVLSNANGTDKVSQSTVLHHTPSTQYAEETQIACDRYNWHNQVYNQSGTYIDTLQTIGGCDSIVTLHLTINRSEREEYNVTACNQYEWHGNTYTENGTYEYHTTTAHGCERIEVLYLTISDREQEEYYETACDEFYWDHNGQTYYESGDYIFNTIASNGCERVEILHLTINHSEREEYWETACDVYWWHDNQYTESGDYEYHTTTEQGCSRVEILHLNISHNEYEEFWETAYGEFWWYDNIYTESGDYEFSTTTGDGCMRIEVLHLTIIHSEYEEFWETACDEFYWNRNGETYYTSGDYEFHSTTDQGYDRVEVLHLTINHSDTAYFSAAACDSYEWHGVTYTTSGTYEYLTQTVNGCDSLEILSLTILGYEPYRLTLDGESRPDSTYLVSVGLENYDDVVGVQYDLHWRGDMTTSQTAFIPSARMLNHNYNVIPLDEDSYRIKINSLSDTKLLGNTGELNQLIFSPLNSRLIGVLDCENARIPIDYVVDTSKDIKVVFKMTVDYCENETGLGNAGAWAGGMSSWFNADRQTFNILCGDVVDDYAFDYTYGDAIEVTMTNGYYEFKNSQGGYKKIEFEPQNLYCSNSLVFCDNPCNWKGSVYYVKIYEDGQLVRNYLPQSDGTLKDFISGTIAYPASGTITYREELIDITPINKEKCYSTITIDNIVLSNANSTDKSSAKDVSLVAELMKWGEETTTACDEYVWNGTTYTETGIYIDTISSQAGCDSIVTLHLTINRSVTTEQMELVCDSYTWTDGKTYTESGTYYQYLQTIHGCDSTVVLHLTINNSVAIPYEVTACDSYTWSNGVTYTQSGVYYDSLKTIHGCDSVEILTLTINYSDTAYFNATSCDSYTWHDETYTTSGTYEYLTQTVNGCDSLEVLTLTINRSVTTEETKVVCDSYTWTDGKTYTESGTYYQYLQTIHGCDSTVVLNLTVNRSIEVPYEVTACDSYTWSNGVTYTQSGVYYDSLKTIHGCDSVEILTLTINYSDTAYFSATACDSYVWHDETYTTSGTYEYLTQTVNGCDSLEVLTLTINRSVTTEQMELVCDSYTWTDGKTYTESGTYYQYLQTIHGCDSTVVLNLTINRSVEVPYEVTTCDSYTWSNGVTYTQSGVYYDSLKTIHGCDSVEILTLTINYSDTAYFSATACDSYVWHDETYTTSGTYEYLTQTVNGCDSLEVLTLTINRSVTSEETYVSCDSYTWNGETYTTSGEYVYTTVAANGCDSIVTLHLTILPDATTESETLALCPSELPYEWYGQSIIEAGTYSATEPYVGMECDSVIHELTLNVYVQTLPAAVTLPIVRMGEAIDVTIPTAEIQAHIAAETWYAPNALVAWYIMENSDWAALSADPVAAGITEVTLKYAVETDCGNVESDKMVIAVETTGLENIPTDVMGVYKVLRDNKIFIIRGGKAYSIMGHLVGDKSVIDPAVTIQ